MACRATVIVAAHFRLVENIGPEVYDAMLRHGD